MKPASLLAVLVFALVALSHLARLVFRVEVVVAGAVIPMWVSGLGFVVGVALAEALWRETQPESPTREAA